jgi:hypothetical protein
METDAVALKGPISNNVVGANAAGHRKEFAGGTDVDVAFLGVSRTCRENRAPAARQLRLQPGDPCGSHDRGAFAGCTASSRWHEAVPTLLLSVLGRVTLPAGDVEKMRDPRADTDAKPAEAQS